ncbi:MAG: alpha/beta hydrolase [Actinobacteria bacterium]|nr:alpha/beta hydrolase [Actinomycetota bacterium]NBY15696.1 alpha/beta hydrolase [Actinomycetota bacterium]
MADLSANSVLPAIREPITLSTSDGLTLVGELALPESGAPLVTIICLHPNPTGGGMMDSHLFRKAAWRLPALAQVAILRFNFRGTTSAAGTSQGAYDEGNLEGNDLRAALDFATARNLPNIWLVGWSFGTDVLLRHGNIEPVQGAVLFSPPLKWSSESALTTWAETGRPLLALVPQLDDYLVPAAAIEKFKTVPQAEVIGVPECKHLWVGEKFVRIAWDKALNFIAPDLPPILWQWDGPMAKWDDLQGRLIK